MTEDLTDDPGNRVKQGSRERLVRSSVCQGRVDRYQPRIMGLSWDKGGPRTRQ